MLDWLWSWLGYELPPWVQHKDRCKNLGYFSVISIQGVPFLIKCSSCKTETVIPIPECKQEVKKAVLRHVIGNEQ